jgi:hypothetical protein
MAVAAWLGLISAIDPNTSASWVGGAAALTLLTIAIGFNVRQYRNQTREISQLRRDKAKDKRECNWQISVLADVLEANGIPMPGKFWDVPEDPVLYAQEEETRRRRRMFRLQASEDSSESGMAGLSIVGIVLMLLGFFAVVLWMANSLIVQPIQDARDTSVGNSCVNSLNADQFATIVFALDSPPNSPERTTYSQLAYEAAERIRHRASICADGKPDLFLIPAPPGLLHPAPTTTTTAPPGT